MLEAKQKLVGSIVFDKYREHALKVIEQIKVLPESCRQSGDDSDLADVWEEFKSQLQIGHSIFFSAYEETIRQICSAVTYSLAPNEMHLLWLWSHGYVEWDEEEERDPPYNLDEVTDQLYATVCEIGLDEPLAREAMENGDAEEVSIPS